ncbi:MAG TPA: hypothetical protein VJW96_04585 [Terriglobales bacterium]|jgi:hypothetical protein|nr:hypothetical protein [Terriglobales bacterium]
MAASPCVAPQVKPVFKKRTLELCEPKHNPKPRPKTIGQKPRVRDLVAEIFEGYEEFLGCTPD